MATDRSTAPIEPSGASEVTEQPAAVLPRVSLQLDCLGHAGFVARSQGSRILIDPWFFPAFLGSWFPWPDNRHLLDGVWAEPVEYLYLSHIHEDHFDRRVLAGLRKQTVVLCPGFRSKSVYRLVRGLGFTEVVVLGHRESVSLGPGLSVTMLLDTSHKEDSGLLVDADGFRFLDLNDCHIPLNEMPRKVDLLAAQFSGAMWYPNCYQYPPATLAAKVRQVRSNLINTLARTALACDGRWYLPSAGPPCFLDPELAAYNDPATTIFHRWQDAAAEFSGQCDASIVTAGPGDHLVCSPTDVGTVAAAVAPPSGTLEDYRQRRRREWAVHEGSTAGVSTQQLLSHFTSLQRENRQLVAGLVTRIRLVSDGRVWDIALGPFPELSVTEGPGAVSPRYTFEVPGWVLRLIVDGRTTWEDALLSLRLGLSRDPDVFDMMLFGLLRYGSQPVQTQQIVLDGDRAQQELIERNDWCLQRFCPHAGEDLALATIDGRVIECPRHHWKWDLATGECLEGGTVPLVVRPAGPAGSSPPAERPTEGRRSARY